MHTKPPAPLVKILEALPEGTDIDVEDLHIHVRIVFLEHQSALDGVHAADIGAVFASLSCRPGAHTLDKSDGPRAPPVRRTDELPSSRSPRIDETLKLEAREHVFEAGVAVLIHFSGIVGFHTRGHDNGTHFFHHFLIGHVEIDATLVTGLHTLGTHDRIVAQAFVGIDHISRWNRLRKRRVNRLPGRKTQIELIGAHYGADLGAFATCRAFLFVDVAGLFDDPHIEVADVALYFNHFTECIKLDTRMPTDIRHLRPQNSNGAVHGWKGLIQLSHCAPN